LYISEFYGGSSGGYVISANRIQGALTFGTQNVGSASTSQTLSITNQGNLPMHFQLPAYTVSGNTSDFVIQPGADNGCNLGAASTLPAGTSCTLSITFTPTVSGNRSAVMTFHDDAANSTSQIVNLTGVGN
jgi:hypothetical protein